MLFGIVHAYLLWAGDILYLYALCAGWRCFRFGRWPPRALLIIGITIGLLDSALYIAGGYYYREMITKGKPPSRRSRPGRS